MPFTVVQWQEMAIRFCPGKSSLPFTIALSLTCTQDKKSLLKIPGMDPEKVDRFAKPFLKLIRQAKQHYDEMKCHDEPVQDPNHQNVIDISSDDDDGEYEEDSEEERSEYFQSEEVRAFNAKREGSYFSYVLGKITQLTNLTVSQGQSIAATAPRPQSRTQSRPPSRTYNRGGGQKFTGRRKKPASRGGKSASKAPYKIQEHFQPRGGGGGGGGIGMMPT